MQDVSLLPGVGPPLLTSAPLLAALSPWLRSLMEGAGEVEDFAIILPNLSSNQVPLSYPFNTHLISFLHYLPPDVLLPLRLPLPLHPGL